jgi:hypothetical protein
MSTCLSPEEMAALVDGKLSGEMKDEFLTHVVSCEACLDEYLFLTGLQSLNGLDSQQTSAGDAGGQQPGSGDAIKAGLAGLGAAVIPLFGSLAGHEGHEQKVAAHEKYVASGERNDPRDDSNHHHGHSNNPDMNDTIHPAERHLGPEGSEERSVDVDQHYSDTCAIRSQQLILRDYGINLTQEQLIREAKEHGWYDHGTPLKAVGNLMEAHGLHVNKVVHANEYNLFHELAQGHEIIVTVNSNALWHPGNLEDLRYSVFGGSADHALIVAGIDTRNEDHPMVIVKDPGTGQIAKEYPMEQFIDAWKGSDCYMVTTDRPAPASLPEMAHFNYQLGHVEQPGQESFEALHEAYANHLQPYTAAHPDARHGDHAADLGHGDHHTPHPLQGHSDTHHGDHHTSHPLQGHPHPDQAHPGHDPDHLHLGHGPGHSDFGHDPDPGHEPSNDEPEY